MGRKARPFKTAQFIRGTDSLKQLLKDSWWNQLKDEFDKPYYQELREMLKQEYSGQTIYPDSHDIFNALHYTPYEDVKAVILGQDPYHGPGQAHGLSFSVQPGVRQPPSLKNIFIELQDDIGRLYRTTDRSSAGRSRECFC